MNQVDEDRKFVSNFDASNSPLVATSLTAVKIPFDSRKNDDISLEEADIQYNYNDTFESKENETDTEIAMKADFSCGSSSYLDDDDDNVSCEYYSDMEYECYHDDLFETESIENIQDQQHDEPLLYNNDPVTCPICYNRADSGQAVALPECGHSFCITCFQMYIQNQVQNGKANMLVCPMAFTECDQFISQYVLEEVLDADDLEKVQRCRRTSFVMENKDYHHCPTPDCSNILFWKEEHGGPTVADCFECKKSSCLKCGASPYHVNQTCDEWRETVRQRQLIIQRRLQRLNYHHPVDRSRAGESLNHDFEATGDESMRRLGIRICRRCGSGVQLSGGCLKLKCRCGYRFCFQCGAENAQCGCTPSHHGFTDNITGQGDMAGLRDSKSYT